MDKNEVKERLALNVKKLRKQKRIPLRKFKGISYQAVWKVENPKENDNPSFYVIWQIAKTLECAVEDLVK